MSTQWQLREGQTLDGLLAALCEGREVFASQPGEDGEYHLVRTQGWASGNELGAYRPVEPIKSLFFRPREFVGLIPASMLAARSQRAERPRSRVAVGVKSCDLASLDVHDHVFLDSGPVDPGYASARENTLVVSADCTGCLDVCFCTAVGQKPHAEAGFDLNIAPVDAALVIEAGSERGEEALGGVSDMLEPADEALLARRDQRRAALAQRVAEQAAAAGLHPEQDLRRAIRESEDALWRSFAARCVECGACNFACCTCHCFLLADGVTPDGSPARTKLWDACLFEGFARVAGGNARPGRTARLRNRFEKKFDFFVDRVGHYACDGCGRCTQVCTSHIDIRDVLRRAVESTQEGGR